MADNKLSLTRIGIFYDGNYFLHVNNYYNYFHARKSRFSISALHEFVRHQVAEEEGLETRLCQVVDSHYFRGRLNAQEASQRGNMLYYDRVFDDLLMAEGVTTHYLPVKTFHGHRYEKGIDVWLALEAYEMTLHKNFDVVVLVASDGDFVPLVRKLNTLGTRVMILSWDFEYATEEGTKMTTRTSQELIDQVSYYVEMHKVIDSRAKRNESLINNLFVQPPAPPAQSATRSQHFVTSDAEGIIPGNTGDTIVSTIQSLKNGYGFIKYPPNNLFFHLSNLTEDTDFNELREGYEVEFVLSLNEKGETVAKQIRLLYDEEETTEIIENLEA